MANTSPESVLDEESGRRSVERLVVIPVYDDWAAASLLLPELDRVLDAAGLHADVLLVDDGSSAPRDALRIRPMRAIGRVDVLALRRNLGHQRALCIGMAYASEHLDPAITVIMDGDGEDDPADVPRLLDALDAGGRSTIVFAARKKRSEPVLFRFFYLLYRALHVVLTGHRVRVGNFSVVPRGALRRVVVVSETWNHYAAAVFNARIAYVTVPTARKHRLDGRSKMSFISLVVHGLSALSVFSHVIGVRVLVATGLVALATAASLLVLFLGFDPLPRWVIGSVVVALALMFQFVIAAALFVFVMLAGRQGSSFIPLRDYVHFVDRVDRAEPR